MPIDKLRIIDDVREVPRAETEMGGGGGTPNRRHSTGIESKLYATPATVDNLDIGTAVMATLDGHQMRCIVSKIHGAEKTVDIAVDPDQYAPVAQTCTFTLKIPPYSCQEVATRQLLRAIVEEGMHLD